MDRDLARVPLRDPQPAIRCRPHPPRPLAGRRRIDHPRLSGVAVDPGDVAARQRRVPDLAARRGRDAVGPAPTGRLEHLHLAARLEAPVVAGLAGEPQRPVEVERRGVEVRARCVVGQRVDVDPLRRGIDAHDRVQPTVGDPRRPVGADDHTVGRRAAAERDLPNPTRTGIEVAEGRVALARVPDAAVGSGRNVVRMTIGRHRELLEPGDLARRRSRHGRARRRRGRRWGARQRIGWWR